MYSTKGLLTSPMTMPTYKGFKVPREEIKYYHQMNSRNQVKMLKHANKKRARRVNYNLILGVE